MRNRGELEVYENRQDLILALTEKLQEIVAEKGDIHLSLSGGSTPKEWFELLKHHAILIPWDKIHFWWGDERCVPPEDAESNYGEAKRILFDHVPVPSENIHRILGEIDPEAARMDYEEKIQGKLPQSNGIPRYDLIILGLGTDGHTASIFQDQLALFDSENICEVAIHPVSGQKRITLTGQVLNNAEEVIFLVAGESKKDIVEEIFQPKIRKKRKSYPAERIKPESGKLLWMLDQAAAQLLE
jgi:6-phosphogluconolactonase